VCRTRESGRPNHSHSPLLFFLSLFWDKVSLFGLGWF
jgi:hypothetical protein